MLLVFNFIQWRVLQCCLLDCSIWDVEAVLCRCSSKWVFLKFPQNSQENTLYRSLLIKLLSWRLATLLKTDSNKVFSCDFCVSFKNSFFKKHLDDCFWRCHAECIVVNYIDYRAAIALKLKEYLEIRYMGLVLTNLSVFYSTVI